MDVIVINNVEVSLPANGGNILVPIKPLCEVLGIDHSAQIQSIKNHPILGSTVVENPTVAGDGKQRNMTCLPIKYIFGWLFSIDARKVKPEAADAVMKYQNEVYDVLYDRFYLEPTLQKQKLLMLMKKENELLTIENSKKEMNAEFNARLKAVKDEIEVIKAIEPRQLKIDFGLN
ncbi:MAG: phage antirepressor N-terminal domain-containing protein [Saprospiraceae bacterium]